MGIRTPSWDFSHATLAIVREMGLLYDSSLMADDEPYDVLADRRRGDTRRIVQTGDDQPARRGQHVIDGLERERDVMLIAHCLPCVKSCSSSPIGRDPATELRRRSR
jgi:hypothetical protein